MSIALMSNGLLVAGAELRSGDETSGSSACKPWFTESSVGRSWLSEISEMRGWEREGKFNW